MSGLIYELRLLLGAAALFLAIHVMPSDHPAFEKIADAGEAMLR